MNLSKNWRAIKAKKDKSMALVHKQATGKILKDEGNRDKIVGLSTALKATEETPMATMGIVIKKSTDDGKKILLNCLDDDVTSDDMYDALCEAGIMQYEEYEVVKIERKYSIIDGSPYEAYFKRNGSNHFALDAKYEKLARMMLLDGIIKKIKYNKGIL